MVSCGKLKNKLNKMDKELKELLKRAFNEGVMYEATFSSACSFKNFIKELELEQLTIPVVVRQSEQLKDKETPTFEVWITQDIKRMEIYATFLDGFANGNLGNLYREYVNTTL